MGLLILFFLLSIIFSFLCSIWEAVILSVTSSYVQVKFQEGATVGKIMKRFKNNIDKPLAAILTLNTIAHTVGAIGVGAQATNLWGASIMSSFVVPVVMTLAILLLSEIIPKTIGANFWRKLAPFTATSVDLIIKILYPFVWLSQIITKKLKKEKNKSVFSRSDITAMTQIAAKDGVIRPGESRILENLMKFQSIEVKDIMTPRTVVKTASEDTKIQYFFDNNPTLIFSRIPLYVGTKDHITGFFMKDDLLTALIEKKGPENLSTLIRPISVVNYNLPIIDLFEKFMAERNHISLVVDEFGGMAGIVTVEDLIETLLGMEIVDEFDGTEDMQVLARQKWEERARKLGIIQHDQTVSDL